MRAIFLLLLGTALTLAPSAAWSQPPLNYNAARGAATDIAGIVADPGTTIQLPNGGGYYHVCPPTVTYGQFGWSSGSPSRYSGGDGFGSAVDIHRLNTGGRTQTSDARADARGHLRAVAIADASSPCIVFPHDAIFMGAYGHANTQFYRAFTVTGDPRSIQINLDWSLQGSFSSMTSGAGGDAYVNIYLLTVPPSGPVQGPPAIYGAVPMVIYGLNSRKTSGNIAYCFLNSCKPLPTAPLVNIGGTIDLRQVYESVTARPMAIGDSFIIVALLNVWTRTCGHPDACSPLLPAFSTDFRVSAIVRSDAVSGR